MNPLPQIKYTLVGIDGKILIDYFDKFGEYVNYITDNIFPKIKKRGQVLWSSHQVDYLYVKDNDNVIVLVMLETGFNKEIALNYIYKVRERLFEVYSIENLKKTPSGSLLEFRNQLRELAHSFNQNYSDKSKLALNKAVSTQNLVVESLANLLDRSNQLNELKEKVETLSENSVILMRNAATMRRQAERRYWITILYMVLLVFGLLYFLVVPFCGFTLSKCFQ